MKPAPDRTRLIAQIHVAKKQLGLGEPEYRDLLAATTGKSSAAAMNASELTRVLDAMKKAGFQPSFKAAPDGKKSGRAVIRMIFGLWAEAAKRGIVERGSREALFAFVKRQTNIDHPEWLDNKQASSVVEAVKAMLNRGKASP